MSKRYGNSVWVTEINGEIVKESISRMVDTLGEIDPIWETLQVNIKRKADTMKNNRKFEYWVIEMELQGTLKDEERHTESNVPDHPEEQ